MFLFSSISQMVVDRVCVVRSQNARECVNQDVLFLGTSEPTLAHITHGWLVLNLLYAFSICLFVCLSVFPPKLTGKGGEPKNISTSKPGKGRGGGGGGGTPGPPP